mmetsp:Transcript_8397/g.13885  ORF Transcript_8397/g.13885 Transcript_8397/m.13885 type:complete len:241 (+) Transcript_8397:93-815(+)
MGCVLSREDKASNSARDIPKPGRASLTKAQEQHTEEPTEYTVAVTTVAEDSVPFEYTKLVDIFDVNALKPLQTDKLSKYLNKTLPQINKHYRVHLSVRKNEFTPERFLMEAIVRKFRQYGWFVALFEYGIYPKHAQCLGKGDLLLVHPNQLGQPLVLAIEAKILDRTASNINHTAKRQKVLDQSRKYRKLIKELLSADFSNVCGLALLAWRRTPDRIMIHRDCHLRSPFVENCPTFPPDQ